MILILSDGDSSAYKVTEYLIYSGVKFHHISNYQKFTIKEITLNDFTIANDNAIINGNDICSYWYRRGNININKNIINDNSSISLNFIEYICDFNDVEIKNYIYYIYYLLETRKKIGSIFKSNLSKLLALRQAESYGLSVPPTLVVSDIDGLKKIDADNLLTKSASFFSYGNEVILRSYSSIIDIDLISASFFPSYVQKYIDKEYEIRSFILIDKFYSMAIFSQSNKETEIDNRRQSKILNRTVPYVLPKYIESKLLALMNNLGLDNGSIDLIRAKDGEFIFLEVNPDGIFENVSYYCNYYLEKKIADYLSKI